MNSAGVPRIRDIRQRWSLGFDMGLVMEETTKIIFGLGSDDPHA
jgi:hypothetical protein